MMEGFGEDVIYGIYFAIAFIVISALIYWYFGYSSENGTIHTDSQQLVTNIRSHLSLQTNNNLEIPNGNDQNDEMQNGNSEEIINGGALQNDDLSGLNRTSANRRQGVDDTCPICLSNIRYGVETNCAHRFCGLCLITYWRMERWSNGIKCPSCRQLVNILLENFSAEEIADTSEEKKNITDSIHRYNRKYSGQPLTWFEYFQDLPTMLRHCFTDFFSFGGLLWIFRIRIIICCLLALLYLLSPLDIIPEAIFGIFGFIDDIIVLGILLVYISIIYRQVLINRGATFLGLGAEG